MMSFRSGGLLDRALPTGTVWLLTGIAEAKGRQEIFIQQTPQALKALRDLQTAGKVVCLGRGPGARWRRKGNTFKRG